MFIKSDCQSYTPTFGAMKKSQFKGLDLVCVNTFKAPIEKFNSNADLQSWAKNKLDTDIFTKNLEGRTFRATAERQSTLESWKNFVEKSKDLTAASALFILSAIFGKLSSKTDNVPPPINVDSVSKTLADIEKNPEINFQKEYLKNLKKHLMDFDIDNYTGWIIIPSNARTEEEFNKNLETLKLLSHHS